MFGSEGRAIPALSAQETLVPLKPTKNICVIGKPINGGDVHEKSIGDPGSRRHDCGNHGDRAG
jgi:hypothetical protein